MGKKDEIFDKCVEGNLEAIKTYINNMGNLAARNAEGDTLLHVAIQNGHEDIVKLLLDSGADINLTNNNGESAFKNVLNCCNFWDPPQSKMNIAKMLVEKGADVGTKNKYNRTGLHLAVIAWDTEFAKILKAKGVDVSVPDESNWTALHYAARMEDPTMLQYLQ